MSVIWDMGTGESETPEFGEATAERGLPEHGFEMPRLMERIEESKPKGSRPPPSAVVPPERSRHRPVVRH